MYKSEVIPTIKDGQQLAVAKFTAAYRYSSAGIAAIPAQVRFYGLDKGGEKLIATGELTTLSSYPAQGVASEIIYGIPVAEYPYIRFEVYKPANSTFVGIVSNPQMILSVTGGTDEPRDDIGEKANLTESATYNDEPLVDEPSAN